MLLRLLFLVIASHLLITQCRAQSRAFQWTFGNNFILSELQECQNMSIVVESITNNASELGVPPYYLIAFEAGGIPTTSMIGSEPSQLRWQVGHRRESALMLSMVDSNGSAGGISPTLFNVTAGSDTSCIPPAPSNPPHIASNVTDSLTTCEPWGLTITNGTQPYSVVLAALDSPVTTNISMAQGFNVFTYIDRANPNGQILAAVVDANDRWGYATSIVNTVGSSNNDCVGLRSSASTSAQIAAQAAASAKAAAEAAERHRRDLIIGIVLGVGLPCIIMALGAWWWRRRRRSLPTGIWDDQDTMARSWVVPNQDPAEVPQRKEPYRYLKSNSAASSMTMAARGPSNIPVLSLPGADGYRHVRTSSTPHVSPPASPPSSPDPPSKRRRNRADPLSPNSTAPSAMPQLPPLLFSELRVPALDHRQPRVALERSYSTLNISGLAFDSDAEPDIIIQHRDGGVVQELPPPYLDRSGAGTSGSVNMNEDHRES
ncbi:uncharacterized protein FIBRA_02059 [Fibroporia radiculosa]|uniref:Mid2 domain-containing protein n=1 Tax=Fibroporia radiculosa TaxID=599839 RepID=J4G1B9_9APHY|nr:uncharacterized protein FIBRA_02059 [Fibroporia radiculosa]CCM00033.1 predicted protein [Fibroporia radiculosa]